MVGCPSIQTTTIMYLGTVCLRINLRLNNIFCYCLNFTFLSLLIIKLSTHKSVSGHLWYSGYNTLYKLLETNQELTVLYFLLPTLVVFLLSSLFFSFSANNFWPYSSIFYKQNISYPFLFLYWYLLCWGLFLASIFPSCSMLLLWSSNLLLFTQSILFFLYIILLLSLL